MNSAFDVIIVGAGASGLSAAYILLKAGLKVCCVEQGNDLCGLTSLEHGGEVERFTSLSYDINDHHDFSSFNVDTSNSSIKPLFYHGVGGSTLVHSSQYPRFHRSDFRIFSLDGIGRDWPLSYDSLVPFYNLNESITGVAGLPGDPMYPDWNGPFLPPVPLGILGLRLKKAFTDLGWHHWPSYAALNTVPYNGRPSDNFHRPTNLGDLTGSKGSVNNTYLPLCLNLGLVLLKNTKVLRLNSSKGRVSSLECINSNNYSFSLKARNYFICAGGIGTPRLLLNSSSPEYPNGLSNSSGMVGKNLMLHPLGYGEGYYEENLSSNYGPQGCCLISQQFYETSQDRNFKRGYTIQSLRGPLPVEAALSFYKKRLLKFGDNFWSNFFSLYNHTSHLTVICEDTPSIDNYISLNHSKLDRHGFPGIKVSYSLSDNSKKMLSHGLQSIKTLLKASGAYKVLVSGPVFNTGWHIHGTCIMGANPSDSVVNSFGRSHDICNLYVFDSSMFPSSSGVNPCSTVQALSLYLATQFLSTACHV